MNFITIDFETATFERDSACEIGLTFVEDFEIVKTESWLIQPPNNTIFSFNTSVHGITAEMTAGEPTFEELWPELKPLLENQFLIAHNAGFDFSVLRGSLEKSRIPFPSLYYSCSYIFSKKVWENLPSYGLAGLCKHLNIALDHHRAGPDSLATAELAIKAFKEKEVNSLDEFPEKLRTIVGQLYEGGYKPSRSKPKPTIKLSDIKGDPAKINQQSIFYGKKVVVGGNMTSMTRVEALQKIADIGGINRAGVTKSIDYLVLAQQNYKIIGAFGMTSIQKKAIQLIEQGAEIEILSEEMFVENL